MGDENKCKEKLYVVTYVDTSKTSISELPGARKPHVLGVFKNKEFAKAFLNNEIELFVGDNKELSVAGDFELMSAYTLNKGETNRYSREWNIEEIEVK